MSFILRCPLSEVPLYMYTLYRLVHQKMSFILRCPLFFIRGSDKVLIEILDPKSPSSSGDYPATPGSVQELTKKFSFNSPPQSELIVVVYNHVLFTFCPIHVLLGFLLFLATRNNGTCFVTILGNKSSPSRAPGSSLVGGAKSQTTPMKATVSTSEMTRSGIPTSSRPSGKCERVTHGMTVGRSYCCMRLHLGPQRLAITRSFLNHILKPLRPVDSS